MLIHLTHWDKIPDILDCYTVETHSQYMMLTEEQKMEFDAWLDIQFDN